MKKVLLTGVAVFASLLTFAQNPNAGCKACSPIKPEAAITEGFHPELNYSKDFFSTTQTLQDVYWWKQIDGPTDVTVDTLDKGSLLEPLDPAVCRAITRKFSYTSQRAAGRQSYIYTQQYGKYEPIGVGFGYIYRNDKKDSTQNTLDLSNGNAYLYVALKNTGTRRIQIRLALQDSLKTIVNAVGRAADNAVYLDEVSIVLAPGQSMDTTINFNKNAYRAKYDYTAPCQWGAAAGKDSTFKYDVVAGATLTFVYDSSSTDVDGFKPFPLYNQSVEISKLFIGNVNAPVGLFDNYIAKPTFKVSPNPVNSGSVRFERAENVTVTDLMGKLVYSAPSASEINVEGFNKGVYIITTSKGAARFVVE